MKQQKVAEIKRENEKLRYSSDEELLAKSIHLQKKWQKKKNIEIEWFALVQEQAFRKLTLRHFDTQLFAGLSLLDGNSIEMKTGEGKTLTSTLAISFKALDKKGVHVVTVNDYLAERDEKTMGVLYKSLHLSSGLVKHSDTLPEKKRGYLADITYVTNSEVVFDYLKDASALSPMEIVQRPLHYCLIDEIDSILIDEARTPLILSSAETTAKSWKIFQAKKVIEVLEKTKDFVLEEKKKEVFLTNQGYTKLESLGTSLYDPQDPWIHLILNALRGKFFYLRNRDYIVLDQQILIVDPFSGRVMKDRRWAGGIHEAIEAKENIPIEEQSKTKLSITYQNFFPLYPSFSGMSGTLKSVETELKNIYNLKIDVIPTEKPMIRKDFPDKVYTTQSAKWKALLKESIETYQSGQPLLIGTTSIEKSEFLSQLFQSAEIPHQVLNAKPENLKRENEIIARAGELHSVTIATNMAGRGTDIVLGGNLFFQIKEFLFRIFLSFSPEFPQQSSPLIQSELQSVKDWTEKIIKYYSSSESLYSDLDNFPESLSSMLDSNPLKIWSKSLLDAAQSLWLQENTKVKNLGGLKVLGTERHESRRIDDQLRGRAGRQGDPGSSQFYISLDDDLFVLFGSQKIQSLFPFFDEDPIESSLLTSVILKAQEKLETQNFEIRKTLFQYERVANSQFQIFFDCRNEFLFKKNLSQLFLRYKEQLFPTSFSLFLFKDFSRKNYQKNLKLQILLGTYQKVFSKTLPEYSQYLWDEHDLFFQSNDFFKFRYFQQSFSLNSTSHDGQIFLSTYLSLFDKIWENHLQTLTYIQETTNWKAYGQQNPLNEYNFSSFQLFCNLFLDFQKKFLSQKFLPLFDDDF